MSANDRTAYGAAPRGATARYHRDRERMGITALVDAAVARYFENERREQRESGHRRVVLKRGAS